MFEWFLAIVNFSHHESKNVYYRSSASCYKVSWGKCIPGASATSAQISVVHLRFILPSRRVLILFPEHHFLPKYITYQKKINKMKFETCICSSKNREYALAPWLCSIHYHGKLQPGDALAPYQGATAYPRHYNGIYLFHKTCFNNLRNWQYENTQN